MQTVDIGKTPQEHFGEYRDTSARPPVRYSSNGKFIGPISVHCEKCENGSPDNSICHHLKLYPAIIPRSHWSCCGGIDRGSLYCTQSPHPGEFRDSSSKPYKRYSPFHDYAGKIRHHCCTKDTANEGLKCAHLEDSEKIIARSHWSCCGNTEKHSISCLITAKSLSTKIEGQATQLTHGTRLSSKKIESRVKLIQNLRPFSDTFDPEVDSEFTDFEYEQTSESELSIEEYNDGPVVWSPKAAERKLLDSEGKVMNVFNIESLTKIDEAASKNQNRLLRSTSHLLPSVQNKTTESSALPSHSSILPDIDLLSEKLVRSGFRVDLSRLRSALPNVPLDQPRITHSVSFSDTPRLSVRLPEISEEPKSFQKGFSSRVSAPLFGNHNSRIAFEASQRKSSLPHSAHIKSFSQAPKENPISITDAFSSRYGVHELQSESAHSEIEEYSQSFAARSASTAQPIFLSPRAESSSFDSNEAHPFETPRSNLRRQAYAIMKASPNISANGVSMCL